MLTIPSHKGNANQNHVMIPPLQQILPGSKGGEIEGEGAEGQGEK
jgi:hypothetical protein